MKLTFKEVTERYLAQPSAHNGEKQRTTVIVANSLVKVFGSKPIKAFEKIALFDNFIENLRKQPSKRRIGKRVSNSWINNKTYKKACREAGLPAAVTFHTIRHTFASWHIQRGTSEMVLMALGGWKDRASLQRYAHLNQAQRQVASSNIVGILELFQKNNNTKK